MLAASMTILGAMVTILGPLLAAGVVAWADRKQQERTHATRDDADESIKAHLGGNPAGLLQLSRQLERLHAEAARKRGHS